MPPVERRTMDENVAETWPTPPKKLVPAVQREACLVHIFPPGPSMGCRYPLANRPLSLGRDAGNDIFLTDHTASRKHALIQPDAEGYYVSDNNSTNGTYVNDKRVETVCLLQDGDYLRVGNCLYQYHTGSSIEANYHEELYRLTIIDTLTQVHNKRYLDEFLEREMVRSQRQHSPLSLLAIDIDNFKTINDTHGHLCGDFVLREFANVVRTIVRQEELFARSGGDEFALVLVETTEEEAKLVAERVRAAVASHQFQFETIPLTITISIGSATTLGDTPVSASAIRHLADARLYEAKRTGRNRVDTQSSIVGYDKSSPKKQTSGPDTVRIPRTPGPNTV